MKVEDRAVKKQRVFNDEYEQTLFNNRSQENGINPQVFETIKNALALAIVTVNQGDFQNNTQRCNSNRDFYDYPSTSRSMGYPENFNGGGPCPPSTSNHLPQIWETPPSNTIPQMWENPPTNNLPQVWNTQNPSQAPQQPSKETVPNKPESTTTQQPSKETAPKKPEPLFNAKGKEVKNQPNNKFYLRALQQDPTKRDNSNLKATYRIPFDDPYWKPCFSKLPSAGAFQPGVFFIDQFIILSDYARVRVRTFDEGTVMVSRKGENIILKEPEDAKKVAMVRCEMCSKKNHSITRCPLIYCCLCKKKAHAGTLCTEPEKGDHCLACKDPGHNHNERALCARKVHFLKCSRSCQQCGARGHTVEKCKNISCCLCGEPGHIGNVCPKPTKKSEVQHLPNMRVQDSDAVLRCLICVKIGCFIYSAELNEKEKFSQINPQSVRLEGFDGFSPSLRLPIKVGASVHEVIFRVNNELLVPISLGKEAMNMFNNSLYVNS